MCGILLFTPLSPCPKPKPWAQMLLWETDVMSQGLSFLGFLVLACSGLQDQRKRCGRFMTSVVIFHWFILKNPMGFYLFHCTSPTLTVLLATDLVRLSSVLCSSLSCHYFYSSDFYGLKGFLPSPMPGNSEHLCWHVPCLRILTDVERIAECLYNASFWMALWKEGEVGTSFSNSQVSYAFPNTHPQIAFCYDFLYSPLPNRGRKIHANF